MKATLYTEDELPMEVFDEKKMAVADQPAEPVDVPKQGLYIVDYKPLLVPTVIALVIFIVWAIATWLL
ncbi:MAG: hypothetical protein IKQ89_10315 [Muribaculaceae bacterium]|nr:hypothetical protein [Muribaculaceae bacterium]